MAITTDSFGNTFAGNYAQGDAWEPNDLLNVLRTALGSNERANINFTNNSYFRIDWRPNIAEETLTGAVGVPQPRIDNEGTAGLAENARMGFSQWNQYSSAVKSTILLASNFFLPTELNQFCPTLSTSALYWAIATPYSVSYFILDGGQSFFLSTGVLQDSLLPYPNNRYGIHSHIDVVANSFAGATIPIATFSDMANYAHINKSDGEPTNSEVELYLRREPDGIRLGFVPNVFKWKVDNNEQAKPVGSIVKLNLSNATGYYAGRGNILCIVVARLGSSSKVVRTGDYLLMPVKF
jgi:hypothetical protein